MFGTERFNYSLVLVATKALDYNLEQSEHKKRKKNKLLFLLQDIERYIGQIQHASLILQLFSLTCLMYMTPQCELTADLYTQNSSFSTSLVPAKLELL